MRRRKSVNLNQPNSNNNDKGSNSTRERCFTFAGRVERFLETIFGNLALAIAKFPLVTIAISTIIAGALTAGVLLIKTENRVEKLYLPAKSTSFKDLSSARKIFPLINSKTEEFIIVPKAGKNLLSKQCFVEILQLHRTIISVKDFDKYCIKLSNKCVFTNPLELFDFNINKLYNISQQITKLYKSSNFLMRNGRPLNMNFDQIFGKPVWSKQNLQSASSVQIKYEISDIEEDNKAILELEKTLIVDVMNIKSRFTCAEVYVNTARSLGDAVDASSESDDVLIAMTFAIMTMFAWISLLKIKNPLIGHACLAIAGIIAVALGIMAGFGLSMLVGIPFISIIGVLPFLILSIGIDDIFMVIYELDRIDVSEHNALDIVKHVMAHTGTSVTMTTLADIVVFSVSTTSTFPAVRYFCIYAAFSITCSYLMIMTFFTAFLSFDVRRMKAGRRDIFPTCTVPEEEEGEQRWTTPTLPESSKIMHAWGRVLMHTATRIVVVVVSLALLGGGVFYAFKVSKDFDRRQLAREVGYYMEFLNAQEKYYPNILQIDIIVDSPGVKYETSEVQQAILKLSSIATENKYNKNLTISWMQQFKSFAKKTNLSTIGSSFMPSLNIFLAVPEYAVFKHDVVLSRDNSSVLASRIQCFMEPISSAVTRKDAMLSLRSDLEIKSDIPAYPITKAYIFLEQHAYAAKETTVKIAMEGAVVFGMLLPFLLSLTGTFIVIFGFGALLFELFAWMYMLDISLNMITMIQIIMAIGFSVDYSAHVAHSYLMSTKEKPEDRAIHALTTTGASVLMGGTSTFLGMVVTALASSEVFRIFFKMFVGIVLLGLIHGLCFLPVYLSLLYRWAPITSHEHPSEHQPSAAPEHTAGVSNEAFDRNLELAIVDNGVSSVKQKVEPQIAAETETENI